MSRLRGILARTAERLRPTSRMGAVRLVLATAGLVVAVAVIAIAVPWAYGEYGYHPAESARSWAALTPQYADAATCQRCHQPEYEPWHAGAHVAVACETCHGPLAEHAATAPETAAPGTITIQEPPADLCVLCHAKVTGRPAAFAQVDLRVHYPGGSCRACHQPHAASARTPPGIPHPLANLPPCVTCHAPAGLKPVPAGHVESPDAVCRSCHRPMSTSQ